MTESPAPAPHETALPPTPPIDHDDASVVTANVVTKTDQIPELFVKFEFSVPKSASNAQLFPATKKHHAIMLALLAAHPGEITIPAINSLKTISTAAQWPSLTAGYKNFFYHTKISTDKTIRYIVAHTIKTRIPFRDLKKPPAVYDLLNKENCYLRRNPWQDGTLDVLSLGWISGIHPRHYDQSQLEERIQKLVNQSPTGGVRLRISPTSPTSKNPLTSKISRTNAYEIQCKREDYGALNAALKWVYIKSKTNFHLGMFIPYKEKHFDNGNRYRHLMIQQNRYLDQVRVVPVGGISHTAMHHTAHSIQSLHASIFKTGLFESIQPTPTTDTEGRWLFITDASQFTTARTWLDDNIALNHHTVAKAAQTQFPAYPQPMVIRKHEDFSNGSFGSTIARSLTSYPTATTYEDAKFERPPASIYTFEGSGWNYEGLTDAPTLSPALLSLTPSEPSTQTPSAVSVSSDLTTQITALILTIQNQQNEISASREENSSLRKLIISLTEQLQVTTPLPEAAPKRKKDITQATPEDIKEIKQASYSDTAKRGLFGQGGTPPKHNDE
jgi:hypothetical protein